MASPQFELLITDSSIKCTPARDARSRPVSQYPNTTLTPASRLSDRLCTARPDSVCYLTVSAASGLSESAMAIRPGKKANTELSSHLTQLDGTVGKTVVRSRACASLRRVRVPVPTRWGDMASVAATIAPTGQLQGRGKDKHQLDFGNIENLGTQPAESSQMCDLRSTSY